MKKTKIYVINKTPEGAYYCHKRGFPYIPVFGSIGDKRKAEKVCKMMNESVGK